MATKTVTENEVRRGPGRPPREGVPAIQKTIYIDLDTLAAIDADVERRKGQGEKISRSEWISEAAKEKLAREGGDN